jgi:hypothetical protein
MANYDQNSHPDPVWQHGDKAVLLCSLLYGPGNNEARYRYVPVRVNTVSGADRPGGPSRSFTRYLPTYRGGSGDRPVSFPATPAGLRAAQASFDSAPRRRR